MEHVFRIEQRSNDFVPASGTVVFNDNIEWDKEMIEVVVKALAELYDCSVNEIKYETKPHRSACPGNPAAS